MNISENMNLHQWAQDMAKQKASRLTRNSGANQKESSYPLMITGAKEFVMFWKKSCRKDRMVFAQ